MIYFLIGYAAIGFVLAGVGVVAVVFEGDMVNLSGTALMMFFWPFVLIAMISEVIKGD